jgi:hypothetical protein
MVTLDVELKNTTAAADEYTHNRSELSGVFI